MNALAPELAFIIDGLGGPEVFVILLLVVMLFGGKKLPEFARGLGKSMREVRKATADVEQEIKKAMDVSSYEAPKPRPAVENTMPTYPELETPPPVPEEVKESKPHSGASENPPT